MALVCTKCGSVEAEGRFCSQCGGPLAEVQDQQAMGAMPGQAPQSWPQPVPPQQPPQGWPQAPAPQQAPQGWPQPAAPQQQPTWPPAAPQQPPGVWPQQPGPQQFAPYPQQPVYQAPAKKRGGWGKWVAIVLGILVLLFVLLAYLGSKLDTPDVGGNPPAPAQTQSGGQQGQGQAKDQTPAQKGTDTAAKTSGTPSFKVAATGSFGVKGKYIVPWKNYVAVGKDSTATLYKVDAKGAASKVSNITDTNSGKLLEVTMGDMFNNGDPIMVALFEKKAYFVPTQGASTPVDNTDGTTSVLIGDYDGDGKNETIFFKNLEGGTHGFDVWRYPTDKDNTPIYKKEGVKDPFPVLYQTSLQAGKNNVIIGYVWEGEKLSALLYKWDGLGGPVEIGRYPLQDAADAQWLTAGPTPLGPTLAISRGGAKPSVELFKIAGDAKSATSLGQLTPDGTGWAALITSSFMGGQEQLMTIDDTGKYSIYDLFYK